MTCPQICQPDLSCAYACAGNARIAIFIPSPNSNHCYSESNPALSSDDHIQLIWEGPATVGTSVPARQDRREEGRIETQVREVQIAANALTIPTGAWVFIELLGDLLGGRIETVARDVPGLAPMTVDMAKPVPFAPTLVELPDWVRGVQV